MSFWNWNEKPDAAKSWDELEKDRQSRERREKVNGVEPFVNPECNCGAKFDREFPNVHSDWCKAYRGNL